MTSQPGLQTVTIHILPMSHKVKSREDNEIWSVIEYNKKTTFL